MRRERKVFMFLLVILLLPAIYLTITPELNLSERYLKISLQNPVKKFKQVKKQVGEKLQKKNAPEKETPDSKKETEFSARKEFKRLHRNIKTDFTVYTGAIRKKWQSVF